MAKDEWSERAKRLLRAEMTRRDISYKRLGELLDGEDEANLRNKLSRGGFSAGFMIQALMAMGCQTLRLGDD